MKAPLKIAFDVDDCLLVPSVASGFPRDTPNYETIAIYRWFQAQGHYMIIWSGSGIDWAKTWAEKFGLTADEFPVKQFRSDIDIAFDDCDVELARINIKVRRLNNSISRKEWNANKQKPDKPTMADEPMAFDPDCAICKDVESGLFQLGCVRTSSRGDQ